MELIFQNAVILIVGIGIICTILVVLFLLLIPLVGFRKSEVWVNCSPIASPKIWGVLQWCIFASIIFAVLPLPAIWFDWSWIFQDHGTHYQVYSLELSKGQGGGGDMWFAFALFYSIPASRAWDKINALVNILKDRYVMIHKNGWLVEFN